LVAVGGRSNEKCQKQVKGWERQDVALRLMTVASATIPSSGAFVGALAFIRV